MALILQHFEKVFSQSIKKAANQLVAAFYLLITLGIKLPKHLLDCF